MDYVQGYCMYLLAYASSTTRDSACLHIYAGAPGLNNALILF